MQHIQHRIADLLGIADYHTLSVAQNDVTGNAHYGGVVGDAAQHNRSGANAAVIADGDVAQDLGHPTR